MKAGFVTILGLPNAGKSTLLNLLLGEKLAIITPKVQTTRHRIKGILTTATYQLVISDTPGIIEHTEYKLHDKMMGFVKNSIEDADVAILLVDGNSDVKKLDEIFTALHLKVPTILAINKIDKLSSTNVQYVQDFFTSKNYVDNVVHISALENKGVDALLKAVVNLVPVGEPFYADDEISDMPTKFFVQEIIREKLYLHCKDEVPYQSTVLITEYKEKNTLTKISANIIVQRESQKGIIIGDAGKMIKKIGSEARADIETFLQQKVFLELFVKARDKWRDNEMHLKEYGY